MNVSIMQQWELPAWLSRCWSSLQQHEVVATFTVCPLLPCAHQQQWSLQGRLLLKSDAMLSIDGALMECDQMELG